jgi:hypothetical protein
MLSPARGKKYPEFVQEFWDKVQEVHSSPECMQKEHEFSRTYPE